jgi:hypothetical protein
LKVHLLFGDKAHIIKPVLVVLILHAYLGKLCLFDGFALIIIVFLKLLLVGLFNVCLFRGWCLVDVSVVEHTHGGEWLELRLLE